MNSLHNDNALIHLNQGRLRSAATFAWLMKNLR